MVVLATPAGLCSLRPSQLHPQRFKRVTDLQSTIDYVQKPPQRAYMATRRGGLVCYAASSRSTGTGNGKVRRFCVWHIGPTQTAAASLLKFLPMGQARMEANIVRDTLQRELMSATEAAVVLELVEENSTSFDTIHTCTAFHRFSKMSCTKSSEQRAQLLSNPSFATLCKLLYANFSKMDSQGAGAKNSMRKIICIH